MNVNNANNPNYVPQYVTFRGETHRNVHGDNNRQIAENLLWREASQRADPNGRLMNAHIMEINALRAANRGSGLSFGLNFPTQASENLRHRQIDVIREMMAEQEEGSFKTEILQRMLENAMRPPDPTPTRIQDRVANANANSGFNVTG